MQPVAFPHPLVLEGATVRLVPLEESHVPGLMAIARAAPELYRFTSTPVTEAQRDVYFARALDERAHGLAYPFAVLGRASGELLGTTRYADLVARHRNLELGYTWYRTEAMGTALNTDCKYLLLRFAFERLGLLRVQIHTDTRNERSRRAIAALGAHYEGVLRRHQLLADGYVRDTIVYAITDQDWSAVRVHLEARLEAKGARPRFVVERGDGDDGDDGVPSAR